MWVEVAALKVTYKEREKPTIQGAPVQKQFFTASPLFPGLVKKSALPKPDSYIHRVSFLDKTFGSSRDWTGHIEIPFSYTSELRDNGTHEFILPEEQMRPTCEVAMEAVLSILDVAHGQVLALQGCWEANLHLCCANLLSLASLCSRRSLPRLV